MKITLHEWINFNTKWIKGKCTGQRFGQAFLNDHNLTDPDIFYEEDHNKAVHACLIKYVDQDTIGANVKSDNMAEPVKRRRCDRCGRGIPFDAPEGATICEEGNGCRL